jgi:hypothetical protein
MPGWKNIKRHKKGTTVTMPQDLRKKLVDYANEFHIEITEVIRMALHQKILRDIDAGILTATKEK